MIGFVLYISILYYDLEASGQNCKLASSGWYLQFVKFSWSLKSQRDLDTKKTNIEVNPESLGVN